jgi:hypothetical protein
MMATTEGTEYAISFRVFRVFRVFRAFRGRNNNCGVR